MTYSGFPFGWTAPSGYTFDNLGNCSSCRAPIAWAYTVKGNRAPLDATGISHFATCPNAELHRKAPPVRHVPGGNPPIPSPETADAVEAEARARYPIPDRAAVTGAAIERAEAGAGIWRVAARAALEQVCISHHRFTSDHFWSLMDRYYERPREPRAYGAVVRWAKKQGWMTAAGSAPSTRTRTAKSTTHHTTTITAYESLIEGSTPTLDWPPTQGGR